MKDRGAVLSARKLLLRDWRGGELGILMAALVLAVGVVVGISAFVTSLQAALEDESRRFLAADQVVSSRRPIPDDWRRHAQSLSLQVVDWVGFSSMVMNSGESMYLASVKAVNAGYPLKGQLKRSIEPYGQPFLADSIPAEGTVWLAPRLFSLLDVAVGDRIWVGDATLEIAAAIRAEPDSTSALFGYGPRVLMNLTDLDKTGVVQPGSRVNYRLLLAGSPDRLQAFTNWVDPQLEQGQALLGLDDGQPGIGRTLDRARAFLLLAGSLGVVLAAAAIALAARRFGERHTDYVAVLKSLGASSSTISWLYGSSLCLMGTLASVLGCCAGFAIKWFFTAMIGDQLGVVPGPSGSLPYVLGSATAGVCLLFFAWPPLRRLAAVSPLRVLRRETDVAAAQSSLDFALGGLAMVGLMWWYAADLVMTLSVVGGLMVTVAAGFIVASVLLRTGRKVGSSAGSVWRLAFAGLQRRSNASALQMVVFGIAIMLMLVLIMIRTSLIGQWQAQLPEGTPDHFMLNIAPDQRAALGADLERLNIVNQPLYPMARGRIMAVNGAPLAEDRDDLNAENGRQREANFTHSLLPPEDTDVIQGQWWQASQPGREVSLEERFAASVGAQVGDRLTFRIGSQSFDATLTSIRRVDWQSMKPNFFVIFPPGILEPFPQMYLTSFYLGAERKSLLNELVRRYPTISVIELDIVIAEIRTIVDRVGQAIELVLAVILVAGALVLVAGVQSSVDVRLRESALLRALGAGTGLLMGALWIEFSILGLFAGSLAVVGAEAASWAIQTQALDLQYAPTVHLWPVGLVAGIVIIGVVGVYSCRSAVNTPPLVVLRDI